MEFRWDQPVSEIVDSLYEGLYVVDGFRRIVVWNKGAERITGFSRDEVLGDYWYDNILNHVDEKGSQLCLTGCPLQASLNDGRFRNVSGIFLRHKDGHRVAIHARVIPLRDLGQGIPGAVELFSEVGALEALEERMRTLELQSMLDRLTGLPNRAFIEALVEERLRIFHKSRVPFGLFFADIDNFKAFNDRFGHEAGDRVLRAVGGTIRSNLPGRSMAARWGGEEFVGLIDPDVPERIRAFAERIRLLVSNTQILYKKQPLEISISVGLCFARLDDTPETLIRRADQLMYISKSQGKNRVTAETFPA